MQLHKNYHLISSPFEHHSTCVQAFVGAWWGNKNTWKWTLERRRTDEDRLHSLAGTDCDCGWGLGYTKDTIFTTFTVGFALVVVDICCFGCSPALFLESGARSKCSRSSMMAEESHILLCLFWGSTRNSSSTSPSYSTRHARLWMMMLDSRFHSHFDKTFNFCHTVSKRQNEAYHQNQLPWI